MGEGQWGSASPPAQLPVGRSTVLAIPLQDCLPQSALLLCRAPGQPGQNLHSLGLRKGGVSWAGLGGIYEQPVGGGGRCGSSSSPRQPVPSLGSPAQPVGQTGRARLSLNGTLLRLHLCQLGRVGADKCYFGI